MTALNFPANPTNGQTYENYVYDGTDGVWKRISPGGTLGNIDDVTINAPADGESLVYDSATGDWINADATVEVYGIDTAETDYFMIPVGGNAARPVTPANGHIRFNSDSGNPEWYSDSFQAWLNFSQVPEVEVEYLVVAGGGGGGKDGFSSTRAAGGGGAGGYLASSLTLNSGTYSLTVGAGGIGGTGSSNTSVLGGTGSESVFSSVTSSGGGGGGGHSSDTNFPGQPGASGGGGSNGIAGGTGISGQGFAGGTGYSANPNFTGGGGGGASEVGEGAFTNPGIGGDGLASSITGSSVTRAGGGAGFGTGASVLGGAGGGGNTGSSGTINTGGGGGGNRTSDGGAGGSGVVILKMPSWASPTFSVGLTEANGGAGQTVGDYKVYTITAGTGSVTFS